MMKKLLLSLLLMPIYVIGFAQIPNGDFESWTTVANDWHLTHFRSASTDNGSVTKYQPSHSGNYAVKLLTADNEFAGALGTWNTNPALGIGGFPYTQKPTKFRVWAKYDILTNDTASIVIMFKKNGSVLTTFLQNRFRITGSHTADYQQLEFDIQGLTETPDTIIYLMLSSTLFGTVQNGSYIIVDDFSFDTTDPIPYGGFEEWGFPVEVPENWNNWGGYEVTLDCGANPMQKTTDKHSGSYALKATTIYNPYWEAVTGDFVYGDYVNNKELKFPIAGQNVVFTAWYKYAPANADDSASIDLTFFKNGVPIGGACKYIHAQPGYTKIEENFDLPQTSDSAIVRFKSSYQAQLENIGSTLYLDDLAIETVPNEPSAAGSISGITNVCKGATGLTYSTPLIARATSYVWTLPTGATGSSATNSISVDFANDFVSGNITVKGHNSYGDGTPSALSLAGNPTPQAAGTITGSASVCKGSTDVLYSVPAITGATSYVWTLPTGVTGTSATNSVSATFGSTAISGNIKVSGQNSCGIGTESTLALIVNEIPTTPAITLSNGTLQSNAANGNQWYSSNSIIQDANNNTYTPSQTGNYYVIVTANGCSSLASNTISFTATGIDEVTVNDGVGIQPNPTSGLIKIAINSKFDTDYVVEVYDNIGSLLQTLKKDKSVADFDMDLGKYPAGLYIIRIHANNRYYQSKVIRR